MKRNFMIISLFLISVGMWAQLSGQRNPATNLQATQEGIDLKLEWDAPFYGGYINYCYEVYYDAWRMYPEYQMAIRFTPDELEKMEGMQLTKVLFLQPAYGTLVFPTTVSYTLNVWTGGTSPHDPGDLVYQQFVEDYKEATWNEVVLNTPLVIDSSKELWIGFTIKKLFEETDLTKFYPGVFDAGPAKIGKSDLINSGNGWESFTENREGSGSDMQGGYNWSVMGYVEPISGKSTPILLSSSINEEKISISDTSLEEAMQSMPKKVTEDDKSKDNIRFMDKKSSHFTPKAGVNPVSYKIYRDGVEIGNTIFKHFYDFQIGLTDGTYNYEVEAIFEGGSTAGKVNKTVEVKSANACIPVSEVKFEIENATAILSWPPVRPLDQRIFLYERFEEMGQNLAGIPDYWINIDKDGDGIGWITSTHISEGGQFPIHDSGALNASSYSYANGVPLKPDNWLISPKFSLGDGALVTYNIAASNKYEFEEHYGVYISETDTDTESFTLLFEETMPDNKFHLRTIDLSAYSGKDVYIAWRHFNCQGLHKIQLDNITVSDGSKLPSYSVSRNGEHIETLQDTIFSNYMAETDDYKYCVTVINDHFNCEATSECITVPYTSPCDEFGIENLESNIADNKLTLTWDLAKPDNTTETIYFESFEKGFDHWLKVDADEDGDTWKWSDEIIDYLQPHEGRAFIYSHTYILLGEPSQRNPDNWIISPAIELTKDNELSFWIDTSSEYMPHDHYGVFISTTSRDDITAYKMLYEETIPEKEWKNVKVDLSEYAGQTVYIAFRHFNQYSADRYAIMLDEIRITGTVIPAFNVYENGEKIADKISENEFQVDFTGKDLEKYCYAVVFAGRYCLSSELTIGNSEHCGEIKDNIEYTKENNFIVYPTLTNGNVTVEAPEGATIKFVNLSGITLGNYKSTGKTDIHLDYENGIYLIMVEHEGNISAQKIVLQR